MNEKVTCLPAGLYEHLELKSDELVSSHKHVLIKHPPGHHTNWRCDRITGSKVCKSEIYSYNSKGI